MIHPGIIPEILLITDGQDKVDPIMLHKILNGEIILHSVMVDGWRNYCLEQYSSTYSRVTIEDIRLKRCYY